VVGELKFAWETLKLMSGMGQGGYLLWWMDVVNTHTRQCGGDGVGVYSDVFSTRVPPLSLLNHHPTNSPHSCPNTSSDQSLHLSIAPTTPSSAVVSSSGGAETMFPPGQTAPCVLKVCGVERA